MRSAPVRSTLHETPGYLASNALPICSDNLRSIEVYQTTLPSFFAASISAVVTGLAGGAADKTLVENAAPAVSTLAPTTTSRREIFEPFIGVSSIPSALLVRPAKSLSAQRTAALRRQVDPDRTALRDVLACGGQQAQLRAILGLNQIVAVCHAPCSRG